MRTLFRVVDFETTGTPTDEERHAICEIGWCDVLPVGDTAWRVVAPPAAMLVNPHRPISIEALAVHHITDAQCAAAPDVTDGFRHLMDGMDDRTTVFVAHNADFEREFFGGGDVPWICTYKSALRVWPDAPSHSNQVLRYHHDLKLDAELALPPHRAGPDAYVTAWLLKALLEAGADPEEMIRWSRGPALLPKVTFGKHKGAKWQDVPTDYLRWLADKSDMSRDVKANARHHLKQREAA
ncbi:DNA polymerase III subunit epsilon [Afifella sp. H1R]|uniref:exonuclease domain-containing protein n=1 Tax=Afifella sp. H1R TaxID=2908841 RepID=UPI001F17AD92|nr:exonuclease domain-containing protein [Afifella sp. H1R]MCF1502159.1 DNA polymerase III subunit epsilon [Afifella sp. H1R]